METGQSVLPIRCNYLSYGRISLHQVDVDETLLEQGKGKFADLFRKQDVNSGKRERLDDLYPDMELFIEIFIVVKIFERQVVFVQPDQSEIGCLAEMLVNS